MRDRPTAPAICLRCGYDLRGLDPASACPECGLAVSFSLSPPTTLSAAPPSWARTLAIGAALVFLSAIGIPAASYVIGMLFPIGKGLSQAEMIRRHHIGRAAVAGAFALHALAVWVLTVREPRTPRLSRRQLGVWVARVCAFGPAVGFAWQLYIEITNTWPRGPVAPIFLVLFYVPVPTLLFLHLRRLSARIGRPRLAEHAGIVGVGLSVSAAVAFLLGLMATRVDLVRILPMLMILPFACMILGYFWGLFLLLRLTVAFARAVGEARATWTHFDAATAPND